MAFAEEIRSRRPQINILIAFTSEVYKQSRPCEDSRIAIANVNYDEFKPERITSIKPTRLVAGLIIMPIVPITWLLQVRISVLRAFGSVGERFSAPFTDSGF
jgi:hypothetical protein